VVELTEPVNMNAITAQFVAAGVWVRPFGKLIYLMPPYIIDRRDLATLTGVVTDIVAGTRDYT
jgi:adenosylmethionine-8-amino-7-oxononanoate aminotransferase